jgi:hypothetical protein
MNALMSHHAVPDLLSHHTAFLVAYLLVVAVSLCVLVFTAVR